MSSMFRSTQISDLTPIKDWNVSNVTNMNSMFSSTEISDLTPLANWNVSNVVAMVEMFAYIPATNISAIAGWNVNSVVSTATRYCGSTSYSSTKDNCFSRMFGKDSPFTPSFIFTSRPGTWDSNGTYIPNN